MSPESVTEKRFEEHIEKELNSLSYSSRNYKDFDKVNQIYIRPEELPYLRGDSSKGRKLLNWRPEYSFDRLLGDMINSFTSQK